MVRPTKDSTRRPNTTAIRIRPDLKPMINLVYRKIVGSQNQSMPIGDKLETILKAFQKKEEALEVENLRLQQELDLANTILMMKDKRIEEMMIVS